MVLMSTSARSKCVAVVCLLSLNRDSRHYLDSRTMSSRIAGGL